MITLEDKDLLVKPPRYPSTEVKEKLGGRWDKERKAWRLAPTSLNVLKLEEWYGREFIAQAPEVVRDLAWQEWGFEGWSVEEFAEAYKHPHWSTLFDFQKESVEYLCCNPHQKSMVVLTPGLGKTAVSVVAADILKIKRVLILAPVKLAKNWKREIRMWEESERDVKRATNEDRVPDADVVVANHEVIQELVLKDENGEILQPEWISNAKKVKEWIDAGPTKFDQEKKKRVPVRERIVRLRKDYAEIKWDLVICDESILLKARKAVKTFVLQTLAREVPWMWFLSGSPTSKFRDDLWRQLNLLFKRGFSSYWRFAEMFCIVEKTQWGWNIAGDNPEVDPQHYLRDFIFVKDQEDPDVLPDLPDYITRPIEIEMHPRQRKAFDQMLDEWIVELEDADPDEKPVETTAEIGKMTRLQQITSNMCNLPKDTKGGKYKALSAKEDLLVDLIENDDLTFPLLVWTWYVPTAHAIYDRLNSHKSLKGKVAIVTGETDSDEADDLIEAYKAGEYEVIVMQMGAGKYGFTMTNTKTVYYHDRSFDADAWVQSLRRVRRIGLKHRPVLIVPQCEDSMDEVIDLNLEGKMASISDLTNAKLLDLLRRLRS